MHDQHQQSPIDDRNVDLARGLGTGVHDLSRGRKPSWTACWVTEKAPEITAWLAMIVASGGEQTSGSRAHSGAIRKKGLRDRRGIAEQQRALAEIIEHQAGKDQREPGQPIALRPKWPMSA